MVASAPFPSRPFSLQIDSAWQSYDVAANRSTFYGWARIHKDAYSPTYSNNPSSSWHLTINGATIARADGLAFDFRNGTDFQLWAGYFTIQHNPDGLLPGSSLACFANYALLGYTEVWQSQYAPRIPRGPRVNVDGVWRNTVAYVHKGDGWQIAIPYVHNGSGWQIGGG